MHPRVSRLCVVLALVVVTGACTPSRSELTTSAAMSPTLTPDQQRRQPEVSIPFSEQNWARGMRRFLFVAVIPHPSRVCENYGFRSKMTMLVGYQTNCASFSGNRRDDLFFYVAVRNATDSPGSFELSNFTLQSQDGGSFRPAGAGANPPSDFLPDEERMPPTSNVFGYVTFDADAARVVPASLNYRDRRQTLTVQFDGEPARAT